MEYNFCPKCGGETDRKLPNLLVCKNCGYNFYINPAPTNAAIIENPDGDILLVTRKFEPKKGYLDLPGGFVEIGESLESSTIRELKEELNIDAKDVKYFGSYPDEYLFQGVLVHTLGTVLTAKIEDGANIKVSDDVEKAEFFERDKIPFEKIAFESLKLALKDYIKKEL